MRSRILAPIVGTSLPHVRTLSTPPLAPVPSLRAGTSSVGGIRPKWYPVHEIPKARTFTPKEVTEWNESKTAPGKRPT
ncbi:hypothetical protein AB1Y20_023630 [Prymnesium parvum]|uniref:Uncharacterized protein n=1 Tax=Prymnesium parvum TaxID=97485 RepID=A0AB34JEU8_PRYPA